MDTKYLKKVGLYILSVILALALIIYIVYHLMDGFTTDITTIGAELRTRKDVISADGYIFRDEHYLYSSYDGAINYLVSDGEKVGIDQAVAETFSDSAGYSVRTELSEIEDKLAVLEESEVPAGAANSDTHSVDKNIASYYYMILSNISEGKYSHAVRSTDSLLVQMNRRLMITGEVSSYSAKKAELEAEKLSLTSKLSGRTEAVYSDMSGYFFTGIDGYEEMFGADVLEALTVSSFHELISRSPEDTSSSSGKTPVGKIAESYVWYIALPVSSDEASDIEAGKKYSAVFPYNYDTELTLTAEKILTEASGDRAVAVFSCGNMPEGFTYLRSQPVEIEISQSEGFRVPQTSVRLLDGIQGVYTLYGSTVVFKRIDILMEDDGYYIVSAKDPMESTEASGGDTADAQKYSYLELYDRIIVEGKELKHGMVFY